MYVIVEYLVDKTIEVVPKKWIQNGTCPRENTKEFMQCIREQTDAPSYFERHAVRKIGDYESPSYQHALEKLKDAYFTYNVSSENENILSNKSGFMLIINNTSDNCKMCLDMPANICGTSQPQPERVVNPEQQHDGPRSVQSIDTGTSQSSSRILDAVQSLRAEMKADFQKLRAEMSWIQNQQEMILDTINKRFGEIKSNQTLEVDNALTLPISNYEMYVGLLQQIEDNNSRKALIQLLKQCGGENTDSFVRRIWRRLIELKYQANFNWSGQNGKIAIKDSPLFKIVKDTVRLTYSQATELDIAKVTKRYFNNVFSRIGPSQRTPAKQP